MLSFRRRHGFEQAFHLVAFDFTLGGAGWLRREESGLPQVTRPLNGALLRQERDIIEAALAVSHGRVAGPAGAAAKLGVPTRTLDSKIKRLGIDKKRFKSYAA